MRLEDKVKKLKEELEEIEKNIKGTRGMYSWESILKTLKVEVPIIANNHDVLAKFRERLDSSGSDNIPHNEPTVSKKRKDSFKRRPRIPGTPKAHDMTSPIIDFLKTCKNMTASKKEIYEGIKGHYPKYVLDIPHRKGGRDIPGVSMVEYRVNWAAWVLTANGKAVGPKKDPSLPEGYIRLTDTNKFTQEEINYLKKNKGYLRGFR
jgi:hypothetical protein